MKNPTILALLIVSGIFYSCGNNSTKDKVEPEVVTVNTQEKEIYKAAPTEVEFNDPKVAAVYEQYINLKTALVNSDAKATANAGVELMTAFANVGVEEDVFRATQTITESVDVEVQRKAFVLVTKTVEGMLEGAITSGTVYKQYCPMAFDFEGAFWLSNSNEIYNPYFGDKMLHCGKVDSEIK